MTDEKMVKGYRKSLRQMTGSLYHKQLESMKLAGISPTDLVDMLRERDKRIEKLDKENGKLEGKLADWQSEYVELENFHNNEVKGLKEQIEKMKHFIKDLIYENHNLCFQFSNKTCLFNSDYRNRAEELIGEKL